MSASVTLNLDTWFDTRDRGNANTVQQLLVVLDLDKNGALSSERMLYARVKLLDDLMVPSRL